MSQEIFPLNNGSALEKSSKTKNKKFEHENTQNSLASDRGSHNKLDKSNPQDNFNNCCELTEGLDLVFHGHLYQSIFYKD